MKEIEEKIIEDSYKIDDSHSKARGFVFCYDENDNLLWHRENMIVKSGREKIVKSGFSTKNTDGEYETYINKAYLANNTEIVSDTDGIAAVTPTHRITNNGGTSKEINDYICLTPVLEKDKNDKDLLHYMFTINIPYLIINGNNDIIQIKEGIGIDDISIEIENLDDNCIYEIDGDNNTKVKVRIANGFYKQIISKDGKTTYEKIAIINKIKSNDKIYIYDKYTKNYRNKENPADILNLEDKLEITPDGMSGTKDNITFYYFKRFYRADGDINNKVSNNNEIVFSYNDLKLSYYNNGNRIPLKYLENILKKNGYTFDTSKIMPISTLGLTYEEDGKDVLFSRVVFPTIYKKANMTFKITYHIYF